MPERGYVSLATLSLEDSHTCTYGVALRAGMGSTDIGVAYATGRARFLVPPAINIRMGNTPPVLPRM
jgi:homoaconitase/3-isopropylmalate dehydratase large subunit